jgi:menaquinone-specific isochorismate synthase
MSERLLVRSTPVPDPGEGFCREIPVPEALAWIRQGAGLVGWGEAARVTLPAGADRFADGEKWLRELIDGAQVDDEVRRRGSGLVAFGSFTFDDASDGSVLIVPRAILGRDGTGNAWLTTITPDGETPWRPAPFDPPEPPDIVSWHDGALSAPEWEQAVDEAVRRIKHSSSLRKVVLARDLYATANRPIDARALLDRLASRYPGCYTFACDGLVGATPELLISRDGWRVSSLILAGTTPRGATPAEDSGLAAALLGSAKENEEHQYAAASLENALAPLCQAMYVAPHPALIRLPNLQHLGTRVRGTLTSVDRRRGRADPRAGVDGPGTVRRPGRLGGRRRQRRVGHRAALRPAGRHQGAPGGRLRHRRGLRPGGRAGGDNHQVPAHAHRARTVLVCRLCERLCSVPRHDSYFSLTQL